MLSCSRESLRDGERTRRHPRARVDEGNEEKDVWKEKRFPRVLRWQMWMLGTDAFGENYTTSMWVDYKWWYKSWKVVLCAG